MGTKTSCGPERAGQAGFAEGVRAGLPIAVGYLPIAVTFGLLAQSLGVPGYGAMAMSLIVFAGASQFVGVNLLALGASVPEITLAAFVLNFRHFLMSSALSRRVRGGTPALVKGVLAFGVTDETFSVASVRDEAFLSASFIMGLNGAAYLAWNAGTFAGVFLAASIPPMLQNSMGIALYAMFVGLVVPSLRRGRPVILVVVVAMAVNSLFDWLPALQSLRGGWGIMAATLAASVFGALLFPRKRGVSRG